MVLGVTVSDCGLFGGTLVSVLVVTYIMLTLNVIRYMMRLPEWRACASDLRVDEECMSFHTEGLVYLPWRYWIYKIESDNGGMGMK